MRFASKLGLTAVVAALVIGPLLGGTVFVSARAILMERIVAEQIADAQQVMREIDAALSRAFNDARIIAADEFLREYVESPDDDGHRRLVVGELEQRDRLTGPWLALMVLDRSGHHLITVTDESGHGTIASYTDSARLFHHALMGEVAWSDRVTSDHVGLATMIFAAPVFARNDPATVIGVVVGHYDWRAVVSILDAFDVSASIHLISEDGRLIGSRSDHAHDEKGSDVAPHPTARQSFDANAAYAITGQSIDDASEVLVVRVSQSGGKEFRGNGWSLVIERPVDAIFQPIRRLAWKTTGSVAVGLLILGLLYVFSARRFVAPLARLRDGVRDVEQGRLDGHLEERGSDEFADLAKSFNTMVQRLRESTVSRDYLDRILRTVEGSLVVLTPRGRIASVNDSTLEMLGYPNPGSLDGEPFDRVLDGAYDLLAPVRTRHGEAVSISHREVAYKDAAGRPVPVIFSAAGMWGRNGELEAIVCAAVDITERKLAEEALAISEERFRNLVESTSDFIWEVNTKGVYTYVSPQAQGILGCPPEELVGKTPFELMPEEEARRVGEIFADMVERRAPLVALENVIRHRSGRLVVLETSGMPFLGSDGTFLGYRGIDRDITERKRAEELVRSKMEQVTRLNEELVALADKFETAQAQLVQSEKMASVGILAAGVAHEINNPIGYVKSNLDSLEHYLRDLLSLIDEFEKMETSLPESDGRRAEIAAFKSRIDLEYLRQDVVELLGESREGVERVETIVRDLKSFSHVDSEETWRLEDLHEALDSTLNVVWNELKYKCEVVREYGDLPPIECVVSQLQQVFMNLLVNAAQAVETHGVITIRTGREGEDAWVEVGDDGQGISADNISRLFEPFFTTKPVGKGTGLGLSVSYGIVHRHHGRIEVQSEEGNGTVFRVYLPVRQPGRPDSA